MGIRFLLLLMGLSSLCAGCQALVPDLQKEQKIDSETTIGSGSDSGTVRDTGSGTVTDSGTMGDTGSGGGADSDTDTADLFERALCVSQGGFWYDENDVLATTIQEFEALVPTCHDTAIENCALQTEVRWAYLADGTFLFASPASTDLWNVDESTGGAPAVVATDVLSTVRCMTNLTNLILTANNVTRVDLSNNTRLNMIDFFDNRSLKEIYIPRIRQVTELHLANNDISHIELSDAPSLRVLFLANNSLTNIDLSSLSSLVELHLSGNFIKEGVNLSASSKLAYIDISENPMVAVVLPENPSQLQKLIAYSTSLTSLSLAGCTALTELDVGATRIATLEVSDAGDTLDALSAYGTQITSLNLAANTMLTMLNLSDCDISDISFPAVNSRLEYVDLYNSNLMFDGADTAIDFTALTQLSELNLYGNPMRNLSDVVPYFPGEFWENPVARLYIEENKWLNWTERPLNWDYNLTDGYAYHK